MTTRIKLRRDTAANWTANNPILALGEPGLDTDANQVKYGDGVTAWNDLVYALGGSGGGRSARWLGIINTCGNGQYTVQSIDGSSWTAPVGVQPEEWSFYSWFTLGANNIVYYENNPGGSSLLYAKDPASEPTPCSPQTILNDVNGDHSGSGNVFWSDMKYLGGYFILVGTYLETNVSPNIWLPQWRYSQDGINWHVGSVNITELAAVVAAEVANGNTSVNGIYLNSLEYNGTGWFLTGGWDYAGGSSNPTLMGGFYITSINDSLNSATHATGVPDSDTAHWDGSRWYVWYQDGEDNLFHTNTSANPSSGSWTTRIISDIVAPLFGVRSDYLYSVEGMASGVVNNTHYTIMAIDDGRSIVTSDGGQTWAGVVPNVTETHIQNIDTGAIQLYNTGDPGLRAGDKITISGSSVSAMNGVFYVQHTSGNWFNLYSDQGLSSSVDTSTWTNDEVLVEGCEFVYGTNKMRVSSTDGLRVGMITNWNFGGYWGGVITAINGLELTFDVPAYSSETNASLYFYNTVTLSTGSYNYRPKFGGGRFLAQMQDYGNQFIAYSKGNPAQQSSWQVVWPTDNQNVQNSWMTDIQYGFVNNPASSWVYQDPNLLEVTNEAILTDKFTVSTTGSGQYDPPLSVSLLLDPNQAGWYISSQCQYGDGDLGSISSFWENDVRMSINNYALGLDPNGYIFLSRYGDWKGYLQFGDDEQLAIGLDTGDSQAADSIAIGKSAGRYNQGQPGGGIGFSIAIGSRAGDTNQGHHAIALGRFAGYTGQGAESIAIGHSAGKTNQHANTIVLNATGSDLNTAGTDRFVVKPVRNNNGSSALYYDATTGEITYGDIPSGSGTSLPSAAQGVLTNDGSNNLTWEKTKYSTPYNVAYDSGLASIAIPNRFTFTPNNSGGVSMQNISGDSVDYTVTESVTYWTADGQAMGQASTTNYGSLTPMAVTSVIGNDNLHQGNITVAYLQDATHGNVYRITLIGTAASPGNLSMTVEVLI